MQNETADSLNKEIASMYRKHANKLRAIARYMQDRVRRESTLEIAKSYDRLAEWYRNLRNTYRSKPH
jgi:hypothetical protein